jgi:hypothetical protein
MPALRWCAVSRRVSEGFRYNSDSSDGVLMKTVRTIGIVNGGGDAPGLNPVIRAIVRASINEHRIR